MKKPYALVSMMKNEGIILPIWLAYYLRHFDPQDVYVTSDNSTDNTVELLKNAGVNVEEKQLGTQKQTTHSDIVHYAKQKVGNLLQQYETVLYAESDEFMVPYTGSLKSHLEGWVNEMRTCECETSKKRCKPVHQYQAVTTLDMIQDIDNEKPLDLTQPLVAQRKWALTVPKFNNAMLWSVQPRWWPSFHRIDDIQTETSNTLYMLHLHHIDFDLCNTRHKARQNLNAGAFSANVDEELKKFFRFKFDKPSDCYRRAVRVELPSAVTGSF